MNQFTLLLIGFLGIILGSFLGYYARISLLKKRWGQIEEKLRKKIDEARQESENIIKRSQEKSSQIIEAARKEETARRREIISAERFLIQREKILQAKIAKLEKTEKELFQKEEGIKKIAQELNREIEREKERLEKISGLTAQEAKNELIQRIEEEKKQELLEFLQKLEEENKEQIKEKAQKILATAIQRYALSQAQETTITTVVLPSEKVKGRIIGKEGRNIKAFEKMTGVEVIIDETPEVVVISSFNPLRRHVAKIAMEKLIEDGRIQPARIEEIVKNAEEEVSEEVKKAGEAAIFEVGTIGLPSKLIEFIGRLKFRTSFGQNVLLHSIEVAHLAGMIAAEMGANVKIAKKAGLLHDIGKAFDHQIEGSHTDIGIKVLEKLGIEKEVIDAMKSHHEEYPYLTIEAHIIQAADQISGARPGARKDTLEDYLKRLEDLEKIATAFSGIEKAYAIQAGREIRVFVRPDEVDDYHSKKLAKEIAQRIKEEINYSGQIKVVVVREMKTIEYAK